MPCCRLLKISRRMLTGDEIFFFLNSVKEIRVSSDNLYRSTTKKDFWMCFLHDTLGAATVEIYNQGGE